MIRRMISILGLTAAMVIAAQPAFAVVWGPESTWYKGIKRATGSGIFTNEGNVRAVNEMTVTDEARDGNTVYGHTDFYFRYRGCDAIDQCTDDFHRAGSYSTPEISNKTDTVRLTKDLAPTGSRARAETFACVQMGWPVPDGCAPAAYPTFDY